MCLSIIFLGVMFYSLRFDACHLDSRQNSNKGSQRMKDESLILAKGHPPAFFLHRLRMPTMERWKNKSTLMEP